MKIGAIPENLLERVALSTRLLPTPLIDTMHAMLLARSVMVASKLGVFNALADEALDCAALAQRIDADPRALEKLMGALISAGYVKLEKQRYALASVARRWLIEGSENSLHDSMLFRFMEWDLLEHYEDFVRTGKSVDVHGAMDAGQWDLYQRGMRSVAGLSAGEVAARMPVAKNASTMLDIGGSHGYYSVRLCRRIAGLRATVLDLPAAIASAAPILARENMGDRVVHRAGDALAADLGEACWDLVLISSLVHHFTAAANEALAGRVARSLRPGGVYAIVELFRPGVGDRSGQSGALMDVFFALASASGTWSPQEMAAWQADAGLRPLRPIHLRTLPGAGIQAAMKD